MNWFIFLNGNKPAEKSAFRSENSTIIFCNVQNAIQAAAKEELLSPFAPMRTGVLQGLFILALTVSPHPQRRFPLSSLRYTLPSPRIINGREKDDEEEKTFSSFA